MLDVGCGNRPKGDVNVDLWPEDGHDRDIIAPVNVKKISNFVKADALHLPFKDGVFDTVYSHDCIEHVSKPALFVKELQRVGKKMILQAPLGKVNDWLTWRVHNHNYPALYPWWYRTQLPNACVKIRPFLQKIFPARPVPFLRYIAWEIVCET